MLKKAIAPTVIGLIGLTAGFFWGMAREKDLTAVRASFVLDGNVSQFEDAARSQVGGRVKCSTYEWNVELPKLEADIQFAQVITLLKLDTSSFELRLLKMKEILRGVCLVPCVRWQGMRGDEYCWKGK